MLCQKPTVSCVPLMPMGLTHNVHRVAHRPPPASPSDTGKRPDIIRLAEGPWLARKMPFAQCACELGARSGVPLDQFIRKQRRIHSICGRHSRGSQEAGLVAAVDLAEIG